MAISDFKINSTRLTHQPNKWTPMDPTISGYNGLNEPIFQGQDSCIWTLDVTDMAALVEWCAYIPAGADFTSVTIRTLTKRGTGTALDWSNSYANYTAKMHMPVIQYAQGMFIYGMSALFTEMEITT